ncbi:MAG TPA: helix-turn-helix transcriptional regulator [Rhodothermales bacterium]|nr:helix-turn-helix transcriptional regulator [Rhodothermales bacterium]
MISKSLVTATTRPIILSILADGENYGYRIIRRIRDLSEGKIRWTTGTLYPALHALENEGLIAATWKAVANAPDRKYYRLTDKGRKALDAEKRQWLDVNAIFIKLWGPQIGPLSVVSG